MIKKLIFPFLVASSTNLYTEFINLDCKANNSYKDLSFNLLLGTETQRATQILKKGQLTMDLKVSNEFYELGQYTDCLLYTSPSPRDSNLSRMPSSA